ncbi:MAG: hypothetical protein HPY50_01450 [Firmicutes bacterium]|nr:hypothetical protein [Bacillota bacterium]
MFKRAAGLLLIMVMMIVLMPAAKVHAVTEFGNPISIGNGLFNMGIKSDGSLWAWGVNGNGAFGDGQFFNHEFHIPEVKIPKKIMENVVSVSTGYYLTMAIKSDGSLWGWGYNNSGQVGNSKDSFAVTIPVKIMDDVISVSACGKQTAAVKSDGSLWVWGQTEYHPWARGPEGATRNYAPVKIMDDVISVSTGDIHSMAIKSDGSLWGWGEHRLLGVGSSEWEKQLIPVKIMDDVISVSTGEDHTVAIKSDGSLWGWGRNSDYPLTNAVKGNVQDVYRQPLQTIPVKIMDDVISVSAGNGYTMAIKSDGSLWAWGSNVTRQIGVGKGGIPSPEPAPVKILDEVAYVCAGDSYAMAIKKDGSLFRWGNTYENSPTEFKDMENMAIPNGGLDNTETALPASATVFVNNKPVAFPVYNISGYNYFKLRDLAMALDGTAKQFAVNYDASSKAIALTTGQPYTRVGGELSVTGSNFSAAASPTKSPLYLNGQKIELIAYNIGGSNYFMLRDIGRAIDFDVTWDSVSNTIRIDTTKRYSG